MSIGTAIVVAALILVLSPLILWVGFMLLILTAAIFAKIAEVIVNRIDR